MIREPPGDPTVRIGRRRSSSTIIGDMELRGRRVPRVVASLPNAVRRRPGVPSGRFGRLQCKVGLSGNALKSVSSLLSRKPWPGTTTAEPMFSSIVDVHDTTLPWLSATVKWVVDDLLKLVLSAGQPVYPGMGWKGMGAGIARVWTPVGHRLAANPGSNNSADGTWSKSASPRNASRSANARFCALISLQSEHSHATHWQLPACRRGTHIPMASGLNGSVVLNPVSSSSLNASPTAMEPPLGRLWPTMYQER